MNNLTIDQFVEQVKNENFEYINSSVIITGNNKKQYKINFNFSLFNTCIL